MNHKQRPISENLKNLVEYAELNKLMRKKSQ